MDILSHLLVPLVALLAVRVPWRRAAWLAPLGVLPDVDALVGPHRAAAHNVWAVAVVALVVYGVARDRVPDAARVATLAAFAYASHLILDLPYGVSLLWPLAPQALLVHPAILVDMGGALPIFSGHLWIDWLPRAPGFADPPVLAGPAPPVHVLVSAGALAIATACAAAAAIQRPWRPAAAAAEPASTTPAGNAGAAAVLILPPAPPSPPRPPR